MHGWDKITEIQPCPTQAEGPGRVVLATMETTADRVLEIVLAPNSVRGPPEGKEEIRGKKEETGSILRPTATHPIFSETAGNWVSAGELRKGHLVRTAEGNAEIIEIRGYPGQHQVFNLEVEGEHEYFAGDGRVLSHNSEALPCPRVGTVERGRLDQHEVEFAQKIVDFLGGHFKGAPTKNYAGIDGWLDGKPVQLKQLTSDKPNMLKQRIEEAYDKAKRAGESGVDLIMDAPNISSSTILQMLSRSDIRKKNFTDGILSKVIVHSNGAWSSLVGNP
jgi:hypothetical protein